jgi:hypothetical protein
MSASGLVINDDDFCVGRFLRKFITAGIEVPYNNRNHNKNEKGHIFNTYDSRNTFFTHCLVYNKYTKQSFTWGQILELGY